jgi:hypothetical protein
MNVATEKNLAVIVRQEERITIRQFNKRQSVWETIGKAFGHEPMLSSGANINGIVLQDEFTSFCEKSAELVCSHPSRFYLYKCSDPKRELIGFRNEELDEEKMYEILSMLLSGKYDVADVGIEERYAYGLTGADWLENKKLLNRVHRIMVSEFAPGSEDAQTSDHMIYAYPDTMRPDNGSMIIGWIYANGRINVIGHSKALIDKTEYAFLRHISRKESQLNPIYSTMPGIAYMIYRIRAVYTAALAANQRR